MNKKKLSISDLNPEEDVASGQHTPTGETMWAQPTVGLADDEEEILKEALGLTDVPASLHGGEILDFQGIPENPGLSRELGDDEETDYFGAEDVGADDLPPENYRQDIEALAKLLNHKDNLKLKSIIKSANNIKLFVDQTNKEGAMINELHELENLLRQGGKNKEANLVLSLKKEAGVRGGIAGAGLGMTLLSIFPPTTILPITAKALIGGAFGSALEDYFTLKDVRAAEELKRQSEASIRLAMQLKQYNVSDPELQQLADNKVSAQTLVDHMKKTGRPIGASDGLKLRQVAEQYVVVNNKIAGAVKAAYTKVGGEEKTDNTSVPDYRAEERTGPIASPAKPIGSTPTGRKGSITIPGDTKYTYDKNPNGEGYIVVSGPTSVGAVLKPGTAAYEKVKAADPAAQATPKEQSRDIFIQAQELVEQAKLSSESGKYAEAAGLYQQAYDLAPRANTLFNVGKAWYDAGDQAKALETFTKYKNEYPNDWVKNQGVVPEDIKNQLADKPAISANEIPEQYKVTRESVSYVLSKFLKGVPVSMTTRNGGQSLTSDTKRARRLAERYMKGMADTDQPEERIGIVATTLAEEFGPRIEAGMKERLDRTPPLSANASEVEKKKREDDLRGLFNGLVWQALREGWAKYKNAPLKKAPTEHSQERRSEKILRQDERDARKVDRQEERQERRASARKEARHNLIEQLHKVAGS